MPLVDSDFGCNCLAYIFMVSGKHNCLLNSKGLEVFDCFGRIGLDAVGNDYMAQIDAVLADMDYCPGLFTGMPAGSLHFHHGRVSDAHLMPVHHGLDALPGHFVNIFYYAVVILPWICGAQRSGNRMCTEPFHMGRQVQQLFLFDYLGMHGHHFKYTFGESTGLVENHGLHL